jgi:ElaB/YqjD/DUF883 family membrane-anchored ribosome-binding protein
MAETAQTGGYGRSGPLSGSPGEGDMKDQAQEKAHEVKEQAKGQAQQVAGQARTRLRSEIDSRSTQAGQQVSQQASDVRSVAEQLRSQGKEAPANIAEQVAQRVESTGRWLEQADADQMLHDVEDFGRRNPWAVMAGGLALGFLASRFLKASSQQRYDSRGLHTAGRTTATNRALPEHATAGYRDPSERFTRTAGGSTGVEPPAPPAGTGGTSF